MKQEKNIQSMAVWSANELIDAGFSRTMAYKLLSRDDVPTIRIGGRKFVLREAFLEWLQKQISIQK